MISDSQRALDILERIQEKLHDCNDTSDEDQLENLIYMLESPLFGQILNIQDSLAQLKQVNKQIKPIMVNIQNKGEYNQIDINGLRPWGGISFTSKVTS